MRNRTLDRILLDSSAANSAHIRYYGTSPNIRWSILSSSTGHYPLRVEKSTLIDQVGRKTDGNGVPAIHLCTHSKTRVLIGGTNTISMKTSVFGDNDVLTKSGSAGLVIDTVGGLPTSFSPIDGAAGIPAAPDWFALKSSFYAACDEYLPAKFLIGEDVAENEIFVEAVKIALNPSHAIKTFVKALRPHMRKLVRPSMKHAYDFAKASGNGFLSYNFGIAPAIKDLKDCLSAHNTVERRLFLLRRNRGQFLPIRVRAKKYASGSPGSQTWPWMACRPVWGKGMSTSTIVMSGFGRVRDDINHAGSWAAYAEYFGVQHIIGLAWELIPFSFVVDWVTNAQERIRNLTRLRLGGPYSEFRAFSCSQKLEQQFDLIVNPGNWSASPSYVGDFSTNLKVGDGMITTYNRMLTPPDGTTVFDFDSWGLFQTLATGSLIIQRT